MDLDWTRNGLADGLRCYRGGAFFEAHEHWERVWLTSHDPEKAFLQALIQLTAACYHFERRNARGTATLLRAALERFERYEAAFGGISVASLRTDVRAWLAALDVGATGAREFPQIVLLDSRPS